MLIRQIVYLNLFLVCATIGTCPYMSVASGGIGSVIHWLPDLQTTAKWSGARSQAVHTIL